MGAVLMFHWLWGTKLHWLRQCVHRPQLLKTEKGEPKRIGTEVPLLTSLTARPNRLTTRGGKVEVLLYVHWNHRLVRDGSPWRPPRLSHSSRDWALRGSGSVWFGCVACPWMSVDILGASRWDQRRSMVQYCFTSTETIGQTGSPARWCRFYVA